VLKASQDRYSSETIHLIIYPLIQTQNLWKASPKWHALTRSIDSCPIFFYFFSPASISILWRICVWMCRQCSWISIATKLYCEWNVSTQTGSGAKCWLDIYHWGAGLAVTGWIRDIGQNILQSLQYTAGPSVQKRTRSASPSQYKDGCSVFVPTIEWLALDFSAHTLSLIFCERIVNTFWQKPVEGINKCLLIHVKNFDVTGKHLHCY
jgi:hypothetical protein